MATPLESLQQLATDKLGGTPTPAAPAQPGPTAAQAASQIKTAQPVSQQEAVRRLLQGAKGTVAPTGGIGVQAPSVAAEQATAQQLQVNQNTILGQLQLQDAEQEQEQVSALQQLSLEELSVKEQAVALREQFVNKTNEILTQFKQQGEQLRLDKQAALVEQAGIMLRLNSEKYIAQLNNEARRKGLMNKQKFFEASLEAAFDAQMDLIQNDLSFRRMIRADEREFERRLAKIDIDAAWDILKGELAAANTQQVYAGGSAILQTGIQSAKEYAKSKPEGSK